MKNQIKTVLVASLFSSAAAFAVDGTLGTTSTGTVNININKGDLVQISGLSDIALGSFNGAVAADITGGTTACVFSTTGGYNVTAQSTLATGFSLVNSLNAADIIPYTVEFNNIALSNNTNETGFTGVDSSLDCNDGTTGLANIAVTVAQADFNAAVTGVYNDILTLIVAPE